MSRKDGENSRYEQTRKPLGQEEKYVRKLGDDVWVLYFILGIPLARNSGCHQRWWLRHSCDLKAGPGAGIHCELCPGQPHWPGRNVQQSSSKQAPSCCGLSPQLPLHASAFQPFQWNGKWDKMEMESSARLCVLRRLLCVWCSSWTLFWGELVSVACISCGNNVFKNSLLKN